MRIGRYEVSAIETGWFALDGGAMFGVVPRPLWERVIAPDDRNRVGLAVRALLLEDIEGPRRILVDTGVGTKWSPKLADIYGIDHSRLQLEKGLAERGLQTGDVTDVLLTHLHFDHAGGATRKSGGTDVPTFENARYHVQARNLAWARQPGEKDCASYRCENWTALEREGVLQTIDGPGDWLPGIELRLSEGHTAAMQLPVVTGPQETLIYCADLIPTSAHVRVPWVMAYDNEPLKTIAEKKQILERAAAERWTLFFEHDPFGPAARVALGERGYSVVERVEL